MRGPQTGITFQYCIQIIDGRTPAGFGEWPVGSTTRRPCRMPPLNVRKAPSKIKWVFEQQKLNIPSTLLNLGSSSVALGSTHDLEARED